MADKDRSRRRSKASQMFGVDRSYPAKNKRIREQNRAINELRVAKEFEAGAKIKDFSKSDQKIFDNLLKRLGKKYGEKEGYQSRATLRDWINNKGGMRNKDQHEAGKVSPLLSTAAIADPKKTRLSKLKDERKQANIAEAINQRSRDKYQLAAAKKRQAKVVPSGDKSAVSASPTGTVYPGTKSAVPASPTGTVYPGAKSAVPASPTGTVYPGAKSKASAPTRRGEERITIKSGDTLSDLAKARGTTLAAIRRANPDRFPTAKSLNIIKAGEKINMPPDVKATTPYDIKTVPVKPRKRKATVTSIATALPKKEKKKDVREQYPTKGTRRELKPLEGGVRYIETPFGRIKMDTSDKAFDYENSDNVTHGKEGGQVKKGVKKTKTKARRRAALRGHRAELRGG